MLVSLNQFGFNTKFNSDDLSSVDLLNYDADSDIYEPAGLIVEAIIGGAKKRFRFPNEQKIFAEDVEDPMAQQLYNYLLNILNKKK
jgi:hypothetical protein